MIIEIINIIKIIINQNYFTHNNIYYAQTSFVHCSWWLILFCNCTLLGDICHTVTCTCCTHRCHLVGESSCYQIFYDGIHVLPVLLLCVVSGLVPSIVWSSWHPLCRAWTRCLSSFFAQLESFSTVCHVWQQKLHSQASYHKCFACQLICQSWGGVHQKT